MRNILAGGGAEALLEIARERPLLVFDFDGTLAPIVEDPERAGMRAATRTLLQIVALMYPCAVVSGRRRADVLGRVEGIPLVAVVGNHGAEMGCGPVDRSPRAEVEAWLEALGRDLADVPGVRIEDKGLSVAIHYRGAPQRPAARRAILVAAARIPEARVFGGKAVVNLVPRDAHHKGDAVEALLRRTGRRTAVFVGDDATDEDAFRCPAVAVGVRVGCWYGSGAPYYVASQAQVDDLLRALVGARRRLDGVPEDVEGLERCMGALGAWARAC